MPTTTKTITALFTNAGAGATGIAPLPTVKVIKVSDGAVTAGTSVEINNGFYKFDFVVFDNAEDYVFEFDAGVAAIVDSQFARGSISDVREQIADAVWDEAFAEHVAAGSQGFIQNFLRVAFKNKRTLRMITVDQYEFKIFEDDGIAVAFSGFINAAGDTETRDKAT